jgi:hypothetical protein
MKSIGNAATSRRRLFFANRTVPRPLTRLLHVLRDRLLPTVYVDASDVPDLPESPYRARLTVPLERGHDGVEVLEQRDVVRGEMKTIYEVHCPCGKRWFNPRLENVQVCPRCGRAVLII